MSRAGRESREMRNDAKWMGKLYEIRVRGHLSPHRLAAFDKLTVTMEASGETIIVADLADQAALYGLLVRIRDLGVPLLSVRCVKCEGKAVDLPADRRRPETKKGKE